VVWGGGKRKESQKASYGDRTLRVRNLKKKKNKGVSRIRGQDVAQFEKERDEELKVASGGLKRKHKKPVSGSGIGQKLRYRWRQPRQRTLLQIIWE